jgi:hypothetical protein
VWWADLLWGFWNGIMACIVLIVHVFSGWEQFPFYNEARNGNWYAFEFLLGVGSPILGTLRGEHAKGSLNRAAYHSLRRHGDLHYVIPYLGAYASRGQRISGEEGRARALCTRLLGRDLLGDVDVVLCTFYLEESVRLPLVLPDGHVPVGHLYSV